MRYPLRGILCLLCWPLLWWPHGAIPATPHIGHSVPLSSQATTKIRPQPKCTPPIAPKPAPRLEPLSSASSAMGESWGMTVSQGIVRVKATGHLPCSSHGDIVWPDPCSGRHPASPATAFIERETHPLTRHGTGFSVPHDRYGGRLILSNYHVVMPALTPRGQVWVQLFSGAWVSGRVVHTEASADLAWILLPASITVPPLQWALRASSTRTGHKVYCLTMHHWPKNTILATGRLINATCPVPENKGGKVPSYMQTSLPIQPGYSGGPLLNTKGQVMGVCSFGYTPENQSRWTMAIPAVVVTSSTLPRTMT